MAHLLLLTQRIPFPPNKGEKIRPFQFLRHWSKSHQIHLGCFIDDDNDWQYRGDLDQYCASTKFVGLNKIFSYLKSLPTLLTKGPLSTAFFHRTEMQHWVDYTLAAKKPEIIIIFSSAMAQYLRGKDHGAKVILMDFTDVDSDKWVQYAPTARFPMSWIYAREGRTLFQFDKKVTEETDASIYVTPNEVALFDKLAPNTIGKSHAISNGVDLEYFSPDNHYIRTNDMDESPSVTFTGTMNYRPNVDAVSWMCKEVLPIIWKVIPDLKFYIVGSSPNDEVSALACDKVIVTGRVEDVRPYLHFCDAAVAPLRIARGIQNKVLEAMAMQKITVVTPHALEGIDVADDKEVYLASTAEDYAAAVIKAVQKPNKATATKIAKNARQKAFDNHSWDSMFKQYDALIETTIKNKANKRDLS